MPIVVGPAQVVEPPPEPPPTPTIEPRFGLGVMLVGGDGSTWDLYHGPVRLLAGASGFGPTDPEHWWKTSPSLDGSRWQGMRIPHKEMMLPLYIHTAGSIQWGNTSAAFFEAVDPSRECFLIVARPDGTQRQIPIRLESGGDVSYDVDPLLLRYGAYALSFVAADPFWQGPQVSTTFDVSTPTPLFPGPPFGIASSRSISSGAITNPGDFAAWPTWEVQGPATGFTLGIGLDVVTLVTNLTSTQQAIIDMRANTIRRSDGTDLWTSAPQADFAQIPAGVNVPLSMSISGAGAGTSITCSLIPLHRMAW